MHASFQTCHFVSTDVFLLQQLFFDNFIQVYTLHLLHLSHPQKLPFILPTMHPTITLFILCFVTLYTIIGMGVKGTTGE